jgi:uncharacterized protein YndB with AHSA1/START domain
MEPVVLTRDVLLDMPIDDLWQLVADPDGLRLWLGDSVDLDVRPGGVGTVRDDGRSDGDGNDDATVVRHVRVDRVEPAHELAFTWWRTDDPHLATQASQVVFQLTAVPGGSHLHITETLLGPVLPARMTATAFAGTARTAWEVRVVSLWACSVAVALV